MKTFSSEFVHDYGTYSFGYCNYAVREKDDTLSKLYDNGYLPYSGSKGVHNTFYMARSARIDLHEWSPSSENRRVMRQHDSTYTRTEHKKDSFDITDNTFQEFCLSYFERHHGSHTMPKDRLNHILTDTTLNTIVEYTHGDTLAGYVFLPSDRAMTHVWFYFYSPELAKSSFGMWVMLNEARIAQKEQKKHFYLGTVYGDKSRYKMNFASMEFWDGAKWLQDTKNAEVKSRTKNDKTKLVDHTDVFKKGQSNFF